MNYTVTVSGVAMGCFTTLQEAVDCVADYARLNMKELAIVPTTEESA